ncbi:MAG: ABC transporter ATP-binding protein [Myxococcaceae bacterium]|jgi:ABC-2 type transport system ATP-binding protein|nr:ABC transporter ATP-binding protein [Myxococcaceae bacterium]MCA3015695.1 ABC transporter ATP-binding protein [Myxococcaceae bacterium]
MAALVFENVTKRFGEKVAVDELSLRIEEGDFVGLLGRNGAGKSTTLKMATGLVPATSGRIEVLGLDIASRGLEARRLMGVMPEDMALLELLTGPQYLRFVGRMYGLDDDVIDRRAAELFDTLDLAPGARTLVADYSFGMKKKLALCSALIHGPKLVFLDEPFEGIDAVTNRTIKDILLSLQQKGVTLVLTSHILEVVERLCPRIAIIDEGRLKAFGTHDELGRGQRTLESLFVDLVGSTQKGQLSWL